MQRTVLLSLLVAPLLGIRAQGAPDTAAVAAIVGRYEQALRRHTPAIMRSDYAPNATWQSGISAGRIGADSIIAALTRGQPDPGFTEAPGTTISDKQVTYLRTDVALFEEFVTRMSERTPEAAAVPLRRFHYELLLSKDSGTWHIRRQAEFELHLPGEAPPPQSPIAPDGTFSDAQVDVGVTQQACPKPKYPAELRAMGGPGSVQVRYIVGADGKIEVPSLRIINSTNPAFNQPAIEALQGCSFTPAKIKGTPVRQIVEQVVRFTLP